MIFLSPDLSDPTMLVANLRHSSLVASEERADPYIRLKSGVSLIPAGKNFLLGLPTRALLLTEGEHVQIARNFTGERNTHQIARGLHCEIDFINDFAELLKSQGLADEVQPPSKERTLDLSEDLARSRAAAERGVISHRGGVRDGGEQEFFKRQGANILISGENRLARHLLVALQASGFSNTRLITRARLSPRIGGADICGIVVRAGDMGKLRKEFNEELVRSAQISRSQWVAKAEPDLIISTLPVEWDYVQRWMSEGSTHLHLNQVIGTEIEIGPLVIPGITPCLRCVALAKSEVGSSELHGVTRSEAPSSVCAYISGLVTLALAQYFETGQTPLRASSHWYDLLDPLRAAEVRHWDFHPQCGCR